MAKTAGQVAADLRAFAKDAPNLERAVTGKAALAVKNTVLAEVRSVAPNLRLSGVGKRGARIGVRYDAGQSASTAIVKATGPMHLIESNTKPHTIPKARKRGKRKVVVIAGVGVRAFVQHPGTKGRHPWRKGVEKARAKVPAVLRAETVSALGKHFGGR